MAKKMTKAQVRKALSSVERTYGRLLRDKFDYGSKSDVPMSINKLVDLVKPVSAASSRIK
jgi:hypothetical protein